MNDDEAIRFLLEENLEGINASVAFVSLYSDAMADFRRDPWPTIQLAIAILLDKPIILAVLPGRKPPPKQDAWTRTRRWTAREAQVRRQAGLLRPGAGLNVIEFVATVMASDRIHYAWTLRWRGQRQLHN